MEGLSPVRLKTLLDVPYVVSVTTAATSSSSSLSFSLHDNRNPSSLFMNSVQMYTNKYAPETIVTILLVRHLQEETVDGLYEEEDKGGREPIPDEQPDDPGEVEEEEVDHQGGDEHRGSDECQSHPGQEEIFLVEPLKPDESVESLQMFLQKSESDEDSSAKTHAVPCEVHVVREASLLLIKLAGEVYSCAAIHYLEHGYGYHAKSKGNAAKANGRHL